MSAGAIGGMDDPYYLDRFIAAQDQVIAAVVAELTAGRKQTHWMWFVFPQIDGLGFSDRSRFYALSGVTEAQAYMAHPILGSRLKDWVGLTLRHAGKPAVGIFGATDAQKFYSSITLFNRAVPGEALFGQALDAFFDGQEDRATLKKLTSPARR